MRRAQEAVLSHLATALVQEHVRKYQTHLGMRIHQLELPSKLSWLPSVVLIEQRDIGRGCGGETCVARARHAPIRLPDHGDARSVRACDLRGVVGRAVVDDDQAE